MGKTTELGKKRAYKVFHVTLEAPDENEQVCIPIDKELSLCTHKDNKLQNDERTQNVCKIQQR